MSRKWEAARSSSIICWRPFICWPRSRCPARRRAWWWSELDAFAPALEDQQAAEQVEIQVKYDGYIKRQQEEIEKSLRHEHTKLPADLDYKDVKGLSNEVVAKLSEAKPESIGIASRISGITPAAISILLVHLKKHGLLKKGEEE